MQAQTTIADQYIQGTDAWLALRKTKITASDAAVILGVSPWKNKKQLFKEKINIFLEERKCSPAMQRGLDLEPLARDLYSIKTGIEVKPDVVIKDWAMASLDGISSDGNTVVEIKCPGTKDHQLAVSGKVPEYYYPQLQHQMYVCGVQFMDYFSFDGFDGVIVRVNRDQPFIEKMITKEKEFYDCMISGNPPDFEKDYIQRDDELWLEYAGRYLSVCKQIKELAVMEEAIREQLILMSGEYNCTGGGICVSQVQRKGNVDYSKIPQLENIDLDKYRKEAISLWRITST